MSRRCFLWLTLLFAVACALPGLLPRWRAEGANRTVAIVTDFRSILPLARSAGLSTSEALSRLKGKGLSGLMVSELTGEDLENGIGPAVMLSLRRGAGEGQGTLLSIMPESPHAERLSRWLRIRLVASADALSAGPVTLPIPINMMKNVGVVPDVEGLDAAKEAGLPIFYRPAQTLGWLVANAAAALRATADAYPIAAFAPAGEIVPGYPDVSGLASVSHERDLPVASVEFSRQVGAGALDAAAFPLLLPLHSVTNEELMARNITSRALRERLLRAAVERSVRLLVVRPSPQNMGTATFDDVAQEIAALADTLISHGFTMGWPRPVFGSGWDAAAPWPAVALAALLLLMSWRLAARMNACTSGPIGLRAASFFAASTAVLALLLFKFPAAARLAGALAAPLVVTEAALTALDFQGRPPLWQRVVEAFGVAVVGGLALAALFSVPSYMLRLKTFSGVKLTLLLPPLLVLVHDLRNRVHPESLTDLLRRPPLWGELLLGGVLLVGLAVMLFRSDNVRFIPGFEARMREFLERLLVARPRSKEVFLGYPCLLLLAFLVKRGLWAQYREVLRIGVVLGFSSVVNSFCHFHTPILFILLREFNGLWTGLLVGALLVAVVRWLMLPLLRTMRPLAE